MTAISGYKGFPRRSKPFKNKSSHPKYSIDGLLLEGPLAPIGPWRHLQHFIDPPQHHADVFS